MDGEGTDVEAHMGGSLEHPVAFGVFVEDLIAGLTRRGIRLRSSPDGWITWSERDVGRMLA
jgi:hypothetical protein